MIPTKGALTDLYTDVYHEDVYGEMKYCVDFFRYSILQCHHLLKRMWSGPQKIYL